MLNQSKFNSSYLTPEEIQRFKDITLKVKGILLSDAEAEDQGGRLIMCFEMFNKVGVYNSVALGQDNVNNKHD